MDGRGDFLKEMMKIYRRLNITNKLKLLSYVKLAQNCEKQAKNKERSNKRSFSH